MKIKILHAAGISDIAPYICRQISKFLNLSHAFLMILTNILRVDIIVPFLQVCKIRHGVVKGMMQNQSELTQTSDS